MKLNDYLKCKQNLEGVLGLLDDIYENCDTSLHDSSYEIDEEINGWNKRFNSLMDEVISLKKEMDFIFKIEEKD